MVRSERWVSQRADHRIARGYPTDAWRRTDWSARGWPPGLPRRRWAGPAARITSRSEDGLIDGVAAIVRPRLRKIGELLDPM
jgi:hypothetical protein